MKIHKLDDTSVDAEEYFIAPEKLLAGNPKQTVWMKYSDPTNRFFVGSWFSDIGKWKIRYTEVEYCELLEGQSIIADEEGNSLTLTKGDVFVVPRGFVGTWEVVTPTRKNFVIYE
jgi:uncharacterized cupin superfamily protein